MHRTLTYCCFGPSCGWALWGRESYASLVTCRGLGCPAARLQALAGWFGYFVAMNDYGYAPWVLVQRGYSWDDSEYCNELHCRQLDAFAADTWTYLHSRHTCTFQQPRPAVRRACSHLARARLHAPTGPRTLVY